MALPKIDTPVFELDLPISKQHIRFRPFLVKEQKNLLMAMEADDVDTINNNIRQILTNCVLEDKFNVDKLPLVDVEFLFLNLRARSVGEMVEVRYRCNVEDTQGKECGQIMEKEINILEVNIEKTNETVEDTILLSNNISVKLKYPQFSTIKRVGQVDDISELALEMIVDSIDAISNGEEWFYTKDYTSGEVKEFVESLNLESFDKLQDFFNTVPKLNKKIEMQCSKCGFNHTVHFEGLESFFD